MKFQFYRIGSSKPVATYYKWEYLLEDLGADEALSTIRETDDGEVVFVDGVVVGTIDHWVAEEPKEEEFR